ncbi:hypothetical protein ACFLZW_04485 [Chloroflexota bacterium]
MARHILGLVLDGWMAAGSGWQSLGWLPDCCWPGVLSACVEYMEISG